MKIDRPYRHKARIEMIPLIDVIFLLLVAFILFSMTMTVHRGLRLDLPEATTSSIERESVIVVSVSSDGGIFLEGEPRERTELAKSVMDLHRRFPERQVLVSGDREASYESIMFVMDALRSAGIVDLILETAAYSREGP